MSDIDKELRVLETYLTTCNKKQFLVEAVWLAFRYRENNPSWDILKCFEQSIWDWLLAENKKDNKSDLKAIIEKVNDISKLKKKLKPKKKKL